MNNKLPERCYGFLKSTKELIIIKRGESGYYSTGCFCDSYEEAQNIVILVMRCLVLQNNKRLQ